MRTRPLITLTVGLLMASAAVYLVSQQMSGVRGAKESVAAEPPFEVGKIVVAANKLEFGNRIGREHLKTTLWPADSRPEGAFSSIDQILGNSSEDRVVLKDIARGEPVLADRISGFGGRASMSTRIPEGKRAFAIRVNAVSGVAGFLLPGDRVDVLLTRRQGARSRQNQVTNVVLQDVMVRGIDQIADEDRNKPQVARTVTVEVTPDEAQKLALAMEVGSLSLALRNMHSAEKTTSRTIGVHDLAGRAAASPTRSRPSVRVRRGLEVSTEHVRGN